MQMATGKSLLNTPLQDESNEGCILLNYSLKQAILFLLISRVGNNSDQLLIFGEIGD
jgi:hypothetical protein